MPDLTYFSESFPPHGGAVADVMATTTAAARLDRTTVLLREVLQNSCDARSVEKEPIEFLIHAYALSDEQAKWIRREFPPVDGLPIQRSIGSGEISVLLFADSNTVGLRGPIDAGEEHEHSNFSNFFFQVGRSVDEGTSAGAFGLGRTVLFTYSTCGTAIVYSRFRVGTETRSRLMGMSLGGAFTKDGRKHTGRHWWGQGEAKPIEGPEADRIASALGMDQCLKESEKTGTSVLILQPNDLTQEETAEDSASRLHDAESRLAMMTDLRRAAELYAWPHMLASDAVSFVFKCDGETLPLRDIRRDPVLGKFARAYAAQADTDSLVHVQPIEFVGVSSGARGKTLGTLSWLSGSPSPADEAAHVDEGIGSHSIALMRQARFVVKYLNVSGVDGVTTRGVFLSDKEYESVYRKAEPVTHDDWLAEKLGYPPRRRNEIKQTFTKIEQVFRQSLGRAEDESLDLGPMPVEIANALGQIFVGEGVHGPGGGVTDPGPDRTHPRRPRPAVQLEEVNDPRVVNTTESGSLIEFDFRISGQKPDSALMPTLGFETSIFTADGTREHARARDPEPAFPRILKVTFDGKDFGTAPSQLNPEHLDAIFTVTVACPAGMAAACSGRLEKPKAGA